MKKVKKMADGGISGLGDLVGTSGASSGGGDATSGLSAVNQGVQTIGSALGKVSDAIGSGSAQVQYKKGGKVAAIKVSTATRSKKSPNW
jgi:hypothetical protein